MSRLAKKLNRRVCIQEIVETPNAVGSYDNTYDTIGSPMWAGLKPFKGRESVADTQVATGPTYKITIRFRRDIRQNHFILLLDAPNEPDRRFKVFSLTNKNERNEYLEIMAEELNEVAQ